ncbi:hypothetical protein HN682_02340, partial [Candidatus Peregrinibacteria bacterium]|nr:hypothetical protein [Candidatus Peregrinibacteria bacterium]
MEFLQNKAAQAILALIIMALLIAMVVAVKNASEEAAAAKSCEASIKIHTDLIKLGVPARHNEIDCPAKMIEINEKNAQFELAESMRKCWNQYGKGNLNMFNGEGIFCSICNVITVDEPVVVENFVEYLASAYVPGKRTKYLADMADVQTDKAYALEGYEEAILRDSALEDFTITKQQPYGVIFVQVKGYDKLGKYVRTATNVLGGAAVVGTGLLIMKGSTTLNIIPGFGTLASWIGYTVGGVLVAGGTVTTIVAEYFNVLNFERYSEVVLRPYTEKTLNETIGCDYI